MHECNYFRCLHLKLGRTLWYDPQYGQVRGRNQLSVQPMASLGDIGIAIRIHRMVDQSKGRGLVAKVVTESKTPYFFDVTAMPFTWSDP